MQPRLKAKTSVTETNTACFEGGPLWLFGSVQWNKLVVRAQKTMCHKLPPHYLQAKLDSFISFVREELSDKDDDSASHTANTDQVPLTFDIPLG